jgi:hypothetical protein
LEIERGSSRSYPVENSLWKKLRTCRKTDYWMNEYRTLYQFIETISYILCIMSITNLSKWIIQNSVIINIYLIYNLIVLYEYNNWILKT